MERSKAVTIWWHGFFGIYHSLLQIILYDFFFFVLEIKQSILSLPTGIIGALETDERHRGHGYDSLVVRALSKKIAEMGYDIYMPLHEDNTSYASLFSSLGFEPVEEEVHWIVTKLNWSEVDQL